MDDIMAGSATSIDGTAAFELYDTYGFPLDLTMLIARENKLNVDEAGFRKEMEQQKERSRAATVVDTEDWVNFQEDQSSVFVGFDQLEVETKLIRYRKVKAKGKEAYQLVLSYTFLCRKRWTGG